MDRKKLARLVTMFKTEARDHTAIINQKLLALERSKDDSEKSEFLEEIFRSAHTLKGAARTTGYSQIATISHHLESVFEVARDGRMELTPTICDVLYMGLDTIDRILDKSPAIEEAQADISELIDRLELAQQGIVHADAPRSVPTVLKEEKQPEENGGAPQVTPQAGLGSTIRVNIAKLESLMAQASELLVFKITAEQRLADVKRMRARLKRQQKTSRGLNLSPTKSNGHSNGHNGHENGHPLEEESLKTTLEENQTVLDEILSGLGALQHSLADDTLRLGMVINNIQDDIRQVRMLPFSTIVGGFERLVRDLSHNLGKDVVLEVRGSEVEVDKKILEEVSDPIMHLLGNAVDHGIEAQEMRSKLGKPAQSILRLSFVQHSNSIEIRVEDDGRGIDIGAIRETVTGNDVVDAEDLDKLTDSEIAQLILLPGVSTSKVVTDVSGRGVGLDVVRHRLESLHGQVEIETSPGDGTSFRLTVPLSLSTAHGLLVRVGDETYAIPIASVVKIVPVKSDAIKTVNDAETITIDNKPTALVRLADVLEVPNASTELGGKINTILLRSGEAQVAFMIDELVGEQEMVVKRLSNQLRHVSNVAGATLLGSGDVVIILNTAELIRSSQGISASSFRSLVTANAQVKTEDATILVVDDSITTRTLEKNILEAAGYTVVTATDGVEALQYLKNNKCDLVVSDVQMPQMDGVQLTSNVRQDTTLSHLPLILVTSLESHEDRQRGLDAGADAYIVKRGFDQEDLLSTIRQLL